MHSAEFILDVIGAGATATSATNWHDAWKRSEQASKLQARLLQMVPAHQPAEVKESPQSGYPTTWVFQVWTLLYRDAQYHWRDPTYLMAKVVLNIASGLLIGFTYYQAKLTIQGTQNHVFVSTYARQRHHVLSIDLRIILGDLHVHHLVNSSR